MIIYIFDFSQLPTDDDIRYSGWRCT